MNKQGANPTINDLLDARIKQALSSLFCIGVGTIQSYDSTTQMADITLNYKRVVKDVEFAKNNIDTVDKIIEYPKLTKCPVVFLGGGVSRLTFPIAVGDPCVVFFADRDLDTYIETGLKVNPPNTQRTHSINDAIAMVGIRPNSAPLADFNTVIASLIDKTGERLAQAGDVKATARTTAPSGWLLAYGQAVSRTTYDVLFAAIGTTYGAGDGSTTFNLPDLRGRTIVGLDNMGGSQAGRLTTTFTANRNTLGGGVGEESHQLTIPEMPIHNHPLVGREGQKSGSDTRIVFVDTLADVDFGARTYDTVKVGNRGNNEPHNNVQPGMMMNWIIKI